MNQKPLLIINFLNKDLPASAFANGLIPDEGGYLLHFCSYPGGTAEVILMNVNKMKGKTQ